MAPAPVRLIHVGIILSLAVAFALRLVSLRADDLLVPQSTAPQVSDAARQDRDIDAALLGRLNALMEQRETWRAEGLTIGKLADQLDIPEYRLRRLINKSLGHRNFSSYINGYRIEAARRALKDPAKARLPVLTIALDLGFGSIGPFNRAFKDATGMTPTEFRRAHLCGGAEGNNLADS
jgi:AraC-like DNA-binding protein